MDFLIKSIFERIEMQEKNATELYKKLSIKTKSKKIKEQLLKISTEELVHDKYINSLTFERIGFVNENVSKKIEINLNAKLKFDLNKVESVLDNAIKAEELAKKSYELLATNLEEPVKTELLDFAKQEEIHKNILMQLKSKFNEKEWE